MSDIEKAIGVFDSGLGGISVLKTLRHRLPYEDMIYYGDSSYAPYGIKSRAEITERCKEICEFFLRKGVKAIVIACNTATSACVKELREWYPKLPIIGMEPALKPAIRDKSHQHVLVMATDFTLKEKKFHDLMSCYDRDNTIYRQPCPRLVELVEADRLDDQKAVMDALHTYLDAYQEKPIDSIVLGCTHFVFYRKQIEQLVKPGIALVDGNVGTARHVEDVLRQREQLWEYPREATLRIYNSTQEESMIALSHKLLEM